VNGQYGSQTVISQTPIRPAIRQYGASTSPIAT
jgi:hypothetical protein